MLGVNVEVCRAQQGYCLGLAVAVEEFLQHSHPGYCRIDFAVAELQFDCGWPLRATTVREQFCLPWRADLARIHLAMALVAYLKEHIGDRPTQLVVYRLSGGTGKQGQGKCHL